MTALPTIRFAQPPLRQLRLGALALLGTFALCLAGTARAQALQPIPKLEARVTDLTGTLTAQQQAALESRLAEFEARKGSQIAVLIVPTTQPEEIEQYSIRVADQWKLGRAKQDDGALLLVALQDRKMRIEVGRGLEGALTDLVSRRIIADTITPLFKQGDFAGGIGAGVEQMIKVVDGEPLPPPDPGWSGGKDLGNLLPFLFVAVFIGSVVLRAILGRLFGSLATGGLAGWLVWLTTTVLGLSVGLGVAAFLFSLVMSSLGSGRWSSSPHRGGWGGGGFGGGGFGGGGFGGGGGGFGGGGGSFGGGGSSGGW